LIEIVEVPRIPRLRREAHKGDRGRVLLVAGSIRMSGAARLAGWGALRGGAGLVTIATPADAQPIVAADLACAMTLPLPTRRGVFATTGAPRVREFARGVDALGIGPGITTEVGTSLQRVLDGLDRPFVLDADGLNLLAAHPGMLDGAHDARVLTPHPGEAARLLGSEVGSSPPKRLDAARALAERFGGVAVLKGADTVVTDGERYWVNRTGNPGMASGGTGDVLTGLIAARLGAGCEPLTAAIQAVHVHGRAGDLAATATGERSMIAEDLVANLAIAMSELAEPKPRAKEPPRPPKGHSGSGSRRRGHDR